MKKMSLEEELEYTQRLLRSYQDLAVDQEDDDTFVARGNGFCDRKYSEDFIEMQVAQMTARIADLERKIHDNNK
ncbi:MAG: hypothetical protein K6F72_05715 [Bacteroidales bacterium]|nr:hypothetical protein [Bacteroidales bacterium]